MNLHQKFITALLSIGLIPTLLVSLVSFITLSSQITQRTAAQLDSIDTKQQQAVSSLLQANQQQVIKLAEQYDFQVALQQLLTTKSPGDRAAVVAVLESKLAAGTGMTDIHVADAGGTIIASTASGLVGQPLQNAPTADSSLQGPVMDIQHDTTTDLNKLFITTSLSINNRYTAFLRAIFNVSSLQAELQDYTGLGSTGETVITAPDPSGRELSLFPLRFRASDKNTLPYTTTNGVSVNYLGKPVMVSTRPLGFSNWNITTMIETQEALAPISSLRTTIILIVIATGIIIGFVAWYLARIFTEPIERIAQVSRRIGQGDFGVSVDVHSNDELGALAGSINTMRESLKTLVTDIESQRNQLSIILDATTDSILAIDSGARITTANRAALELTKLSASSIIGHSISEVLPFTTGQELFAIDYSAAGSNTYPSLEYTDSGGSKHYLRVIVDSLKETSGRPQQSIVTIRDETKSRELESMKVDFVSMAAHELRTPLAAIRGYIELISFSLKRMTPEVKNYMNQALRSSAELSALISNLLDVSRIERGTFTLNLARVDLAEAVTRTVHDVTFAAKENKIKLTYAGPAKGCLVAADDIAIREVISNLLTNAVKYTREGGSVEASLSTGTDSFTFTVKDTGIGIPKSAMPHLFTKFFRVHGGLASGSTGTGLGLFIAKSIIERHDGSITADSTEGKGSAFTFTIPKLTEDHLASMQAEVENVATRRHRGWITKRTTR